MFFKSSEGKVSSYFGSLALLPNVRMSDFKSIDKKIWMAKSNSIYVTDKEKILSDTRSISPLLTKIIAGRDSVIMDESFYRKGEWGKNVTATSWVGENIPELSYKLNSVSFFWSTPYYIDEETTVYSHKLDGFDSDWSGWEQVFYKDYTNLPYGHYHFRVKAKTATQIETNEIVYEFFILKPWYLTALMIVIYAIASILIILAIKIGRASCRERV